MTESRNGDTPLRVGISGSYGGFNLGDEAILQVIVDELRRSAPLEITVFSRDAKDTSGRHRVDHVVELRSTPRREAQEILHNLDLFILGGGGLLYRRESCRSFRSIETDWSPGIGGSMRDGKSSGRERKGKGMQAARTPPARRLDVDEPCQRCQPPPDRRHRK